MSTPVTAHQPSWPDELRSAEIDALKRLRQLTQSEDSKLALRACEVIVRFAAQCRRDEAWIAVETARAEATREKTATARAATAARRPGWGLDPLPTSIRPAQDRPAPAGDPAREPLFGG